ncbi:MAG TPA: GNAT family N-acetyltransferase [Blastocatellia bacterium]|nr:GNAT family N-acetyltransferase [Blastocatellia bacterium]HMY71112.1 GNAT family N-acetyltransferase [Blastocatellia bacterium]HMZ19681.1 GNAT family N-acetyltransferase [Blastocatellia bacterium]HNG33086.1 GNAT family N-acetyltransferase [Blastocatellia bacterium]
MNPSICFRPMTTADIAAGLRLCRAAHWNQTARDWELFLRLSPQSCCVAVENERVIGTVATARYENRFSWIGMVLVDPDKRGQGVATRLMNEALGVLEEMPSIKLDATPAGHAVYRKLGFVDEYCLSRMEVVVPATGSTLRDNPARPMTKADLPAVADFDREVFGANRRVTLEWLLSGAPDYAWVIEEQRQIAGYTFGRHGFNFEHLGPVVARDQDRARTLVAACLQRQAGRRFVIDASHFEPDWRAWLESTGFREQRPFIRMFYRGNPYPGLPAQQFGILGPEFG